MKKTILLLIVLVIAASVLAACGPDYSKELEAIGEDMQSATDEWLGFMTQYGEEAYTIQTVEDLNTFYSEMSEKAGDYAEKFRSLEMRLDDIQGGISETEYSSYKASLEAMIDAIEGMMEQMEAAMMAE